MAEAGGKRLNKKIKIVIAVAAAVVIILCGFIIIRQVVESSQPANKGVVVYKRGADCVIRIGGKEKVVAVAGAENFKCDEEGERVFFTVNSAYSDGLFDLYYTEIQRGEIINPKIIDFGIDGSYEVVSNKVYYMKNNADVGANDGCFCDIESKKIETFSGNVENIYPIKNTNEIYFTKMHGDIRVLYKYADTAPAEVCREVTSVYCYNKTENPHVIFEKKSHVNTGMTELYIAYTGQEPELICDNTYSVMYDDYSPSGNLYYFSSSNESVSWSYVISDEYATEDETITKPERKDFLSFFGISTEYNEAFRQYQDKLIRDEIRAALNECVENGEFSAPVFTAFAYNSEGTFKISENVDPKNVYTVSAFGAPKMIFDSTQVLSSGTDMATLVSIAQRSSMSEVIEYARSVVSSSVKSKGLFIAAHSGSGAVSYEMSGYDKQKTLFSFSKDGSRVFAFVREVMGERLNLYTNDLDSKLMPSAPVNVDTNVSSYRFIGDSVLYLKSDIGKNSGDIFDYDGNSNVKISNAAAAFMVESAQDILILKNHDVQALRPTADYYIYEDSNEVLIDDSVVVSSFGYSDGRAAYISGKDDKSTLMIYGGGKTYAITDGVSDILFFK